MTNKDYPKSGKDIRKNLLNKGFNILRKNVNKNFHQLWVQEKL